MSSSPWIRGAPQLGFARCIARLRSRSSTSIVGRPGPRERLFHRQYKQKPAAVPPDHRRRPEEDERLAPSGPAARQPRSEDSVGGPESNSTPPCVGARVREVDGEERSPPHGARLGAKGDTGVRREGPRGQEAASMSIDSPAKTSTLSTRIGISGAAWLI